MPDGKDIANEGHNSLILLQAWVAERFCRRWWGGVFDCRALPNPFWDEALRYYSGCDAPVTRFMDAHSVEVEAFMRPVVALVENSLRVYAADGRTRLAVAFGCTGGQHRSVYCAERLAAHLRAKGGVEVEVEHAAQAYWQLRPTPKAPQ